MRIHLLLLLMLLPAMLAIGCGSASHTYSISVENQSAEPYMVWLTKNGPPIEPEWMSPEQVSVYGIEKGGSVPGTVVQPGKTVVRTNVRGSFAQGSEAILRLYRGERKFAELLAIQADSPNRTEIPLAPGENNIIIHANGKAESRPASK